MGDSGTLPPQVLRLGDGFEMNWIDAVPNPAQVIYLKSLGDLSHHDGVRQSVN